MSFVLCVFFKQCKTESSENLHWLKPTRDIKVAQHSPKPGSHVLRGAGGWTDAPRLDGQTGGRALHRRKLSRLAALARHSPPLQDAREGSTQVSAGNAHPQADAVHTSCWEVCVPLRPRSYLKSKGSIHIESWQGLRGVCSRPKWRFSLPWGMLRLSC